MSQVDSVFVCSCYLLVRTLCCVLFDGTVDVEFLIFVLYPTVLIHVYLRMLNSHVSTYVNVCSSIWYNIQQNFNLRTVFYQVNVRDIT